MGYIDPTANAPVVMEAFHARIHEGTAWHWSHRYESIANDAVVDTIFEVFGNAHLVGRVEGTGAAEVDFINVTSWTAGTSVGPTNRNGFMSHVASMIVHHTASMNVSNGVIVETMIPGGGPPGNPTGGETGGFSEFILAPGVYAIRFTNVSGSAADFAVQLEWYNAGNAG